jgi:predicted DNA-binding transcriptional regulator AlpA
MTINMVHTEQYALAPEIAQRYRTSTAQVYQWARERKFPQNCVLRIGKKMLFDLKALDEWAANGGSPLAQQSAQTA